MGCLKTLRMDAKGWLVMAKPWEGRFSKATQTSVENFTESLSYDYRLYPYDIRASIAHATMLGETGLIPKTEARKIISGLKAIEKDFTSGNVTFDPSFEDIHMLVEHLLIRKIGPTGKKLHTARSRNDQIATDMRLWLLDVGKALIDELGVLQQALLKKAKEYKPLIMPGFTHLQHAQPVGVSFYLMAFMEKFDRDVDRLTDCLKRADVLPLGACALAGTTLPIDREIVADQLGFSRLSRNSMDAVSDRDFLIEYCFLLALIATHISNICEDMIIWASAEYAYVTIDDGYCTGSSIMPQKKNPDVHELLRGKTARVHGALYSLLTLMKGLPQAYNRDMQEDKERIFDAHDTVYTSVQILCELVAHTRFNEARLLDSTRKGYMEATALAEYLVKKGIAFREAHHMVGRIVRQAESASLDLAELELESLQQICPNIDKSIYEVLTCEKILNHMSSAGGSGRDQIQNQLDYWDDRLQRSDPAGKFR
jgi:argininosuccinate lyase